HRDQGGQPTRDERHRHWRRQLPELHLQRAARSRLRVAAGARGGRSRRHDPRALPDGVRAAALRRRPRDPAHAGPARDGNRRPHESPDCYRAGECMKTETGTGKYERLLERCASLQAIPTAVAHPCDPSSLAGAVEAGQKGLIKPILVGPKAKIEEVAKASKLDLSGVEIVEAAHSHA